MKLLRLFVIARATDRLIIDLARSLPAEASRTDGIDGSLRYTWLFR